MCVLPCAHRCLPELLRPERFYLCHTQRVASGYSTVTHTNALQCDVCRFSDALQNTVVQLKRVFCHACCTKGFLGLIAYLGAANAGAPLAWVVHTYGWTGYFSGLAIACGVAVALLLPLVNAQSRLQQLERA